MEKIQNRMESQINVRKFHTMKQFPAHDHVFRNESNRTDYKCANITQHGDGKVVITLTPMDKDAEAK